MKTLENKALIRIYRKNLTLSKVIIRIERKMKHILLLKCIESFEKYCTPCRNRTRDTRL